VAIVRVAEGAAPWNRRFGGGDDVDLQGGMTDGRGSKELAPEHRQWAQHMRDSTPPGQVAVSLHTDARDEQTIGVFSSRNEDGVVAATVGLMDYDVGEPDEPRFVELIVDARGDAAWVAEIVATLAFHVMKDGWKPAPGVIFERAVEMYSPELQVKHVMFVPPIQWEDEMGAVELDAKTIHPLLAVPITESEAAFVRAHGSEALEDIWARAEVDVFDWSRSGVV
jgi:hypothetical protein